MTTLDRIRLVKMSRWSFVELVPPVERVSPMANADPGQAKVPDAPFLARAQPLIVVDDSHTMLMVMTQFLTRAGFTEVEYVSSATQALARLHERRFRLVMSDIEMPVHSGIDLLRTLRTRPATRDLPVLLVTASMDHRHIGKAKAEKASGFLLKPFTDGAMRHAIAEATAATGTERKPETGAAGDRNYRVSRYFDRTGQR
jgi:two-component system, chemotaxis family, chemotaxis protein CheY